MPLPRPAPTARAHRLRALALPACLVALGFAAAPAGAALTLAAPVTTPTLDQPEGVALADVDHDGVEDAVVGNRDLQAIQVFPGGAAGFGAPTSHETGHNLPIAVDTGDFDEDGDVDLVSSAAVGSGNGRVAVLLGDGAGGFAAAAGSPFATTVDGPSVGSGIAVADVTGDGHLDVLTGGGAELVVLPGDGTGALLAPVVTALGFSDLSSIAVGDFAGDGRPDVVTGSEQPQTLSELYENVGGALVFRSLDDRTGNQAFTADLDGAGRDDLVFSRLSGNDVGSVLSTGDGTFSSPPLLSEAAMFFVSGMAVADVDADGRLDLAVGGADAVELMAGAGPVGAFASFPGSPIASLGFNQDVALGDVTGDAQPDLVFSDADADTLTLVRNLNTGAASGPAGVDFGAAATGGAAVERTVTLTSTGTGFYRAASATVAPGGSGVAVADDTCAGLSLAVGATCAITLRFTPGAAGPLAATLTVADNSPAGSRAVPLTATVTAAAGPGVPPSAPRVVPGPLPGSGSGSAPDRTRPVVGALRLTPATFPVGSRSTATSAATRGGRRGATRGARGRGRARARRGSEIRLTLSEAARVTFAFERRAAGLRSGRRCVAPTRALRLARAASCIRFVAAGTLTRRSLSAGDNRVAFSGRIGTKALKPGRYRVAVAATDAAGNRSITVPQAAFKVVAGR